MVQFKYYSQTSLYSKSAISYSRFILIRRFNSQLPNWQPKNIHLWGSIFFRIIRRSMGFFIDDPSLNSVWDHSTIHELFPMAIPILNLYTVIRRSVDFCLWRSQSQFCLRSFDDLWRFYFCRSTSCKLWRSFGDLITRS